MLKNQLRKSVNINFEQDFSVLKASEEFTKK